MTSKYDSQDITFLHPAACSSRIRSHDELPLVTLDDDEVFLNFFVEYSFVDAINDTLCCMYRTRRNKVLPPRSLSAILCTSWNWNHYPPDSLCQMRWVCFEFVNLAILSVIGTLNFRNFSLATKIPKLPVEKKERDRRLTLFLFVNLFFPNEKSAGLSK